MKKQNNNVYGVLSNGVHTDISKSLSATKRYANENGYNEITIRYNGGYNAEIVEKKEFGIWVSTDLNKRLTVYDNGGRSLDRYTITDNVSKVGWGMYEAIAACKTGNVFYTHIECQKGKHLGNKILLSNLSEELRTKLENEFNK